MSFKSIYNILLAGLVLLQIQACSIPTEEVQNDSEVHLINAFSPYPTEPESWHKDHETFVRESVPSDYLWKSSCALYNKKSAEEGGSNFCNCIAIAPRKIITARHCFSKDYRRPSSSLVREFEGLRARFGFNTRTEEQYKEVFVKDHSVQEVGDGKSDVVVLELVEDLPEGYKPIPILEASLQDKDFLSTTEYFVGSYGFTQYLTSDASGLHYNNGVFNYGAISFNKALERWSPFDPVSTAEWKTHADFQFCKMEDKPREQPATDEEHIHNVLRMAPGAKRGRDMSYTCQLDSGGIVVAKHEGQWGLLGLVTAGTCDLQCPMWITDVRPLAQDLR